VDDWPRLPALQIKIMKRETIFNLLAILMGAIIVVLCMEVVVRAFADDGKQFDLEMWKYALEVKGISPDPLIGHDHRPNRHAFLMGVQFDTNSKGLRDREFSYEKPPGKLRIMMLGDSFTVGWGAKFDETFSKRIERLYADRGIQAEVINTGVGNYNTIQEVEYYLTEGYKYNPDIVVLNFFVNDAEPVPVAHPPPTILRTCYSCIFVAGTIDSLSREFFAKKDWADYYLDLYGDDGRAKGWLDAKAYIAKLAAFTKAHGTKLLIANLPELHDVQHYSLQKITDLVREAADQNDVPFVDLLPYVQGVPSPELWVTPPDPHPNGLAHKLFAQGIFEALEKLSVDETEPKSSMIDQLKLR
jgi:lysophospholipase L1-like esterase